MNCASSFFGIPVVRQCLSSRLLEGGRPLGGGFGDVQVMKGSVRHAGCCHFFESLDMEIWGDVEQVGILPREESGVRI